MFKALIMIACTIYIFDSVLPKQNKKNEGNK